MITDIKINLLPWREEVREQQKKEFLKITIAILVLAGAMVGGVDRYYNRAIDHQTSRNAFLQVEIQILEERIEEIRLLQQKRNELLSRMTVIQELQGNRPVIVRVFDEMARVLPDELFIESIQAKGGTFTLKGRSASNIQISNMMRSFDQSPWFINPNLLGVNANEGSYSSFDMIIGLSRPASGGEK